MPKAPSDKHGIPPLWPLCYPLFKGFGGQSMFQSFSRVCVLAIFSFSIVGFASPKSKQHMRSRAKPSDSATTYEASAEPTWKTQTISVDRDTCIMALLHHARKIDNKLKQTEFYLKAAIGQAPRLAVVEWIEKPQLVRNGARSKVQEALREIEKARQGLDGLAGRNGSNYALATITAQNRCEEGLRLGETESSLVKVQQLTQALFDNGYVDMKETNFGGFSETFLGPIFEAQNEVDLLGAAVTAKPERRVLGLFGSKNPHEKSKSKLVQLERNLRKDFPLAFSDQRNTEQMLAVNSALVDFIANNEIGYSDAAHLWKSGLVRNINSNSAPLASAAYLDDFIVDRISR
jgi:hypothetical protein